MDLWSRQRANSIYKKIAMKTKLRITIEVEEALSESVELYQKIMQEKGIIVIGDLFDIDTELIIKQMDFLEAASTEPAIMAGRIVHFEPKTTKIEAVVINRKK